MFTIYLIFTNKRIEKAKKEHYLKEVHGIIDRIELGDKNFNTVFVGNKALLLKFKENEVRINDSISKESNSFKTEVYRNHELYNEIYW